MRLLVVVAVASLSVAAASAQPLAGERYYMTVFGAQSSPLRLRLTHTFAEFTRTVPTPMGEMVAESHTVSWMPATLRIRPLALRPEPGTNLTLQQTLDWVASFNGRVSMWGPREIGPERYYPSIVRKAQLESGTMSYRAIGGFSRDSQVSNCGQSFSRAGPVVGRIYLQPVPLPGELGTGRLVRRYERAGAFVEPGVNHPQLLPALGATTYPLIQR